MAASTITRSALTDGSTPWNVSTISSAVYDRIDELFSGVGTYATLELGGALKINGALTQLSNDGGALGTTSLGWSDLFLASGGVINWNVGDVTITHSTNTLTFAGAASGYIFNDGNVGLGVTPNANWATYRVLQLGEQGVVAGYGSGAGVLNVGANFYWDGSGHRYLATDFATQYQQNAGDHLFRTASSGTAGNAITFDTRLSILNNGNVGIGTSSPSGLLHVSYNSNSTGWQYLQQVNTGASAAAALNVLNTGGGDLRVTVNSANNTGGVGASGVTIFQHANAAMGFGTNATERLRITSGGNVGIGTSSPAYRLDVNGSGQIGSTILQEATAFLSSSGNTMVGWSSGIAGYTNGSLILQSRSSAACPIVFVTGNGAGADRGRITDAGEWWIGYTTDQGAYLLQVNSQIFATNATIATSDGRFKTDVQPVREGLAAVKALQPVQFKWKKHPVHNFIDGTDVGFIAQDVRAALTGRDYTGAVVTQNGSGENEFLGMADSKLIPLLVAAVQELSAEVNALKAH